jgi:hypothetical protein
VSVGRLFGGDAGSHAASGSDRRGVADQRVE